MRVFKQILLVYLTVALVLAPAANATPVTDLSNLVQNSVTAVQSKLQQLTLVKQAVSLGQQLSEMQKLYSNAKKMYDNVGNYKKMVTRLKNKNWTNVLTGKNVTWDNLGYTLDRWGTKASDDRSSPLAQLNDGLFGKRRGDGLGDGDSKGFFTEMDAAIRKNYQSANSFSRDTFLRGVFKDMDKDKVAALPASVKSEALIANANTANAGMVLAASKADAEVKEIQGRTDTIVKNTLAGGDESSTQAAILAATQGTNNLLAVQAEVQAQQAVTNAKEAVAQREVLQEQTNVIKRSEAVSSLVQAADRRN